MQNERYGYYPTQDTNLASALLALGIPASPEQAFTVHRSLTSDKKIFTFYFEAVSNCGKFKTGEMIKMWDDPALYENSEHPLAYMKCLIKNREGLLDVINQSVEMVTIEKNGKLCVVSKGASKEFAEKLFAEL